MIKDKDVNSYLKKRQEIEAPNHHDLLPCLLYTSPSPRDTG